MTKLPTLKLGIVLTAVRFNRESWTFGNEKYGGKCRDAKLKSFTIRWNQVQHAPLRDTCVRSHNEKRRKRNGLADNEMETPRKKFSSKKPMET